MLTNEQHALVVDLVLITQARTRLAMLITSCNTVEDERGLTNDLLELDAEASDTWKELNK